MCASSDFVPQCTIFLRYCLVGTLCNRVFCEYLHAHQDAGGMLRRRGFAMARPQSSALAGPKNS